MYYCSLYCFITINLSLTKYIKSIDHNCSVMVLCLFHKSGSLFRGIMIILLHGAIVYDTMLLYNVVV